MALVTSYFQVQSETESKHRPVTCGWREVVVGGERLLQIDTYGTAERAIPNKVSQSLQFDVRSAAELRRILDEVFPGISQLDTDRGDTANGTRGSHE